ncbi:MAG: cysteine hydrolase [Prolixibacteraceae bacterium]|jgi:nicotinamidase/pyrazinamidase|nr:cysteine hydrolase [Prolixibacteraceae bacterium]MBT6766363.1 cysteine hydrolase [Prolixibacteraceae bacterium]MBT7000880.1 cysteine hydrolase [Prolixibacteraceae bacterium]MBT7394758.1 cysteine hydrolase [Prolixibacteraceae bacterium]
MDLSETLFWNVDTQKDFVKPNGKLYVQDAEKLLPKWGKLTQLAKEYLIRVVNSADYHFYNSAELDSSPDFINTFPEHCMAGTKGAEFVKETRPEDPSIFDWNKEYLISPEFLDREIYRNFIIRKDIFDVFAGNPWTDKIIKIICPKIVLVYGVTTNVCVDFAVKGLVKRVDKVYVIEDAIKELPNIALPFKEWKKLGVNIIQLEEVEKMLN